jgi:hypothetical protein
LVVSVDPGGDVPDAFLDLLWRDVLLEDGTLDVDGIHSAV